MCAPTPGSLGPLFFTLAVSLVSGFWYFSPVLHVVPVVTQKLIRCRMSSSGKIPGCEPWQSRRNDVDVGPPESPTTVPMYISIDSSKVIQKLSSRRAEWAVCPPCPESAVAGLGNTSGHEAYANKTWARTSSFSSAGWSLTAVNVTVCVVGFQTVRS